jgi:hypothetical protein
MARSGLVKLASGVTESAAVTIVVSDTFLAEKNVADHGG